MIARATVALAAVLALGGCVQSNPAAYEKGTVLAATPADQPGETSGAGTAVGQAVDAASHTHDGIAYTIRLSDGRVVTIVEHINSGDQVFGVGAAVILETSGSKQKVLPGGTF